MLTLNTKMKHSYLKAHASASLKQYGEENLGPSMPENNSGYANMM